MSEYTPKVGDRVRATLGENVLVGFVRHADQDYTELAVGPGRSWTAVWHHDGWQFEQVVELPSKVGAVIEVHRERPLFLVRHGAHTWFTLPLHIKWTDAQVLNERGFTVHFEGVDE